MKQRIIIFTLGLLAIACSNSPEVVTYEDPQTGEMINDTLPFRDLRDFPEVAKETNIDSLITGMIQGDCVYESAVGFGGAYTKEYACFERLSELLSEKELFELVEHRNANVRLYAYKALTNEESEYLEEAKSRLKLDTSSVCTFSGCMQMTMKLKDIIAFESN